MPPFLLFSKNTTYLLTIFPAIALSLILTSFPKFLNASSILVSTHTFNLFHPFAASSLHTVSFILLNPLCFAFKMIFFLLPISREFLLSFYSTSLLPSIPLTITYSLLGCTPLLVSLTKLSLFSPPIFPTALSLFQFITILLNLFHLLLVSHRAQSLVLFFSPCTLHLSQIFLSILLSLFICMLMTPNFIFLSLALIHPLNSPFCPPLLMLYTLGLL